MISLTNRGRQSRWLWLSLTAICAFACCFKAAAQTASRFKAGDAVQVSFLREWIDAKVVETNRRGDVLAEFEFAGATKREAFGKNDVRFAFEADALVEARMWTDATGSFKTRAALIRIDEGTITLRKPDMAEIKIPVAKLSETDQKFLERLKKELGPAAERPPELLPLDKFDTTATPTISNSQAGNTRAALQPDPVPTYQKLKQGGVAFGMDDTFDRLGAVLPLGGRGSLLLAAVENGTPGGKLPTRLLWASLEQQKIDGRQLLPAGEVVMDYHPASRRLLTYNMVTEKDSTNEILALTVWEVLPADKQAKPIVRWNAQSDSPPHEHWGRLIDANTVVQRFKNQEYVGWDLVNKQMKYRLAQESFFAPYPTLSGGRRYLFLPEDKQVRVFEAATGQSISTLPSSDGSSAVAVTEDGTRAAVLGRSTVTVWNLTSGTAEPGIIQAEAIGSPFRASLAWIGQDRLMSDQGAMGLVLFSLKDKLALWNYKLDMSAVLQSREGRLREIIDGHLVYAASVTSGSQRGLAVGAVTLPGPKVEETVATLDRDSLLVMKRGSSVRLDVQAGEHAAMIRAALEKEIAANGWTLSTAASATLLAEMKRGETQQVTYQMFGRGEQSATVTPFISQIQLTVGDEVAWQAATSSGAPPFIRLAEGETVQDEINKWQHPNPGFFSSLDIPESILDPKKRRGLGATNVTTRGLVPE